MAMIYSSRPWAEKARMELERAEKESEELAEKDAALRAEREAREAEKEARKVEREAEREQQRQEREVSAGTDMPVLKHEQGFCHSLFHNIHFPMIRLAIPVQNFS